MAKKMIEVNELFPLYDRIVVLRDKPPEKSAGGLIVSGDAKHYVYGTVIAVGDFVDKVAPGSRVPMVGEKVMFTHGHHYTPPVLRPVDENTVILRWPHEVLTLVVTSRLETDEEEAAREASEIAEKEACIALEKERESCKVPLE